MCACVCVDALRVCARFFMSISSCQTIYVAVLPLDLKHAHTQANRKKIYHLHDDNVDFSAQKHIARNLPIQRILCLERVEEEIISHCAAHQHHRLEKNGQRRWLFATRLWFMHPVPVPGIHITMHQITQSTTLTRLLLQPQKADLQKQDRKRSSGQFWPLMRMRSVIVRRCGDVKSPVSGTSAESRIKAIPIEVQQQPSSNF